MQGTNAPSKPDPSLVNLMTEVKRWDERFFQLSKDTLGFTRTVVTIASGVVVLIPLLKDVAPLVIEVLRGGS